MKKLFLLSLFTVALTIFASAEVSAQDKTAPASKSVAGEWDAQFETPGGAQALKLMFAVDGEKISGTVKRSRGDLPVAGTIKGDDISFAYTVNYNGNDLTLSFWGKVKGDSMAGSVSFGGQAEEAWSARRTAEKPKTDKP